MLVLWKCNRNMGNGGGWTHLLQSHVKKVKLLKCVNSCSSGWTGTKQNQGSAHVFHCPLQHFNETWEAICSSWEPHTVDTTGFKCKWEKSINPVKWAWGAQISSPAQECVCIERLHLRTVILRWRKCSVKRVWSLSETDRVSEEGEERSLLVRAAHTVKFRSIVLLLCLQLKAQLTTHGPLPVYHTHWKHLLWLGLLLTVFRRKKW